MSEKYRWYECKNQTLKKKTAYAINHEGPKLVRQTSFFVGIMVKPIDK